MSEERLQKILAQAGIASRRAAEKFITEGRVRVNGEIVTELGAKANPDEDTIEVDGHGVLSAEPTVYIAMHKPIHVVTTVSDPEKRQTVIDVLGMSRAEGRKSFEGNMPRVFPVGRLDFDAEGLLLLTNDGGLANDLLHPRFHVPKTYVVKVSGRPDERQLGRLQSGVRLREEDGSTSRKTAPAEVSVIRESPANTWLELVITEGRHHQVKRMCDAIGHSVIRLIRTEMGGVELGELEPGHWRFLTEVEVELLKAWRSGNAAELRALRGPTTTERMFGERSGQAKKRSGAPRARSEARSGAPRERAARPTRDASEAPRTRTYRADRDGPGRAPPRAPRRDDGGGRTQSRAPSRAPRRDDGASRAPRRDDGGGYGAPRERRGSAPAPRGPRSEAPRRDYGRGDSPRGDYRSEGGPRTGRGGARGAGDRSGAPRSAPRGDTRGPARGAPRGDGPRGNFSRDDGPRRDYRGDRDDAGPRAPRGGSRGAPRSEAPRGERRSPAPRGGARSGAAPRGGRPTGGGARGPRPGGAPRGGSRGPRRG